MFHIQLHLLSNLLLVLVIIFFFLICFFVFQLRKLKIIHKLKEENYLNNKCREKLIEMLSTNISNIDFLYINCGYLPLIFENTNFFRQCKGEDFTISFKYKLESVKALQLTMLCILRKNMKDPAEKENHKKKTIKKNSPSLFYKVYIFFFFMFFGTASIAQDIIVPSGSTQYITMPGVYANINVSGTLYIEENVEVTMRSWGQMVVQFGGKIIIKQGATLSFPHPCSSCKINNNGTIEISGALLSSTIDNRVMGKIIITPTGNLYRNGDLSFDSSEYDGEMFIYQKGTSSPYEYNYWSSPMYQDGREPNGLGGVTNYDDNYGSSPTLSNAFMNSSSFYRMVNGGTYDWFTMNHLNWASEPSVNQMIMGKGYAINGPNGTTSNTPRYGDGANTDLDIRLFYGRKDFFEDIKVSVVENYNLIGNPYPTSLDIETFLQDNVAKLKEAAISLWDGNYIISGTDSSLQLTGIYENKYIPDGYITVNLLGSVPTNQNGDPLAVIGKAQGFIVNVDSGVSEIDIKLDARTIESSLFFRNTENTTENKSLLWLSVYNKDTNEGDEVLFGFTDSATLGLDKLFDADKNYEGQNVFLSMPFDEHELAIQGYPKNLLDLNEEIVVPLSLRVSFTGIYHFDLLNTINFPENVSYQLRDVDTNMNYDLSQSIEMYLDQGIYPNRFQLIILPIANTLSQNDIIKGEKPIVYFSNNYLHLKNYEVQKMQSISVYNLLGQPVLSIYKEQIANKIPVHNLAKGMYVLKINEKSKIKLFKINVP